MHTIYLRRKSAVFSALLLLAGAVQVFSQTLQSMEFRNQPITDILMVLADISQKSIVPDETVSGNATYYFSNTNFNQAFQVFLSTYKLYSREDRGVTYVSRIRAEYAADRGLVTLDAEDVQLDLVIRALSRALSRTILFDALPRSQITLHVKDVSPEKAISIMIAQFTDYRLETDKDYFYIKRAAQIPGQAGISANAKETIKIGPDGLFSLTIERARFLDVLEELFKKTGREYSLFLRADLMLENMRFAGKTFDEVLRLILEQAGGDWTVLNNVYYIVEVQKRDILKKLDTVVQVPLTYLSVQDLPTLFPQELAGQNFFRLDKATNSVILSGSIEEIAPIEAFIRQMDKPLSGRSYFRFDLVNMKVNEVLPLIPQRFAAFQPQIIPNANAFIVNLSREARAELDAFVSLIDRTPECEPVKLKYIKAENLLKSLPPSAEKENIIETGDPRTIFFKGNAAKRARFLRDLAVIDKPVPQIRYDLLVVQYERKKGANWNTNSGEGNIKADKITNDAANVISGTLGNLLSLNLDIISTFGYKFAADFSLQLIDDTARVLADTTLNGLSGEDIKFQNTTTDRYRDFEIDPDTGKQKSTGVTRELASGLLVTMNGWTSGDGMITMKVAATVSRTGSDTSATNPPTTYEKVVQTHVRTQSGTPVVIGGLLQQHVDKTIKKIPLLGDIPLLGLLFRTQVQSVSDTEFVIYIIPRLEDPEQTVISPALRLDALYERFVKPVSGAEL